MFVLPPTFCMFAVLDLGLLEIGLTIVNELNNKPKPKPKPPKPPRWCTIRSCQPRSMYVWLCGTYVVRSMGLSVTSSAMSILHISGRLRFYLSKIVLGAY